MAKGMDVEESYLDSEHEDVTILALRFSCRRQLGMFLNLTASQPLHNGLLPDYTGLAELIGFEYIEICNFARDRDPTNCLLNEWGNKPEMKPTLGNLVNYLKTLERSDILGDCKESIKRDAEHYLEKKKGALSASVQDQTVSQSPYNIDDMSVDETQIMTIQDVTTGCPTYYDAFVCYNPEPEDLDFVKKMIEKLENREQGLKLFVPHRDDLPGASKHVISAKLIQERCKRMVIVMSPRYLQSDACDFQTKFAHALAPGSRSKKLVPVLISQCKTPNILHHVTMCDYTRGDLTGWFWERLYRSLQAPLNPYEITIQNPNCLTDLQMKLVAQTQQLSLPRSKHSPTPPMSKASSSQQISLRQRTTSSSSTSSTLSSSSVITPQLSSSPLRPVAGANSSVLLPSQPESAAFLPSQSNNASTFQAMQSNNSTFQAAPVSMGATQTLQSLEEQTPVLEGAASSGNDQGPPLSVDSMSVLVATGVKEMTFTNSAPPSPNASQRGSGSKGKKLLSRFTAVFKD